MNETKFRLSKGFQINVRKRLVHKDVHMYVRAL